MCTLKSHAFTLKNVRSLLFFENVFSHFFIKYASSGEEVIKKIDRAALLLLLPPAAPPPSTGWMLLRFSNFSQTNLSVLVFEYKKQKA